MLRECIAEAHDDKATSEHSEKRLRELHGFFETAHGCYEQARDWPTSALVKAAKMGGKLRKLLGLGG